MAMAMHGANRKKMEKKKKRASWFLSGMNIYINLKEKKLGNEV